MLLLYSRVPTRTSWYCALRIPQGSFRLAAGWKQEVAALPRFSPSLWERVMWMERTAGGEVLPAGMPRAELQDTPWEASAKLVELLQAASAEEAKVNAPTTTADGPAQARPTLILGVLHELRQAVKEQIRRLPSYSVELPIGGQIDGETQQLFHGLHVGALDADAQEHLHELSAEAQKFLAEAGVGAPAPEAWVQGRERIDGLFNELLRLGHHVDDEWLGVPLFGRLKLNSGFDRETGRATLTVSRDTTELFQLETKAGHAIRRLTVAPAQVPTAERENAADEQKESAMAIKVSNLRVVPVDESQDPLRLARTWKDHRDLPERMGMLFWYYRSEDTKGLEWGCLNLSHDTRLCMCHIPDRAQAYEAEGAIRRVPFGPKGWFPRLTAGDASVSDEALKSVLERVQSITQTELAPGANPWPYIEQFRKYAWKASELAREQLLKGVDHESMYTGFSFADWLRAESQDYLIAVSAEKARMTAGAAAIDGSAPRAASGRSARPKPATRVRGREGAGEPPLEDSTPLSVRDGAKYLRVSLDRLKKRCERYRNAHRRDGRVVPVERKRPRAPVFLYHLGLLRELAEDLPRH